MNNYEIERSSTEVEYGNDALSAEWHPIFALQPIVSTHKRITMPADLATVDVELFLQRMIGD